MIGCRTFRVKTEHLATLSGPPAQKLKQLLLSFARRVYRQPFANDTISGKNGYNTYRNRSRPIQTFTTPLESQKQGMSLFASAVLSQRS